MRRSALAFCFVLGSCGGALAQQPAGPQVPVATGQERSSAPLPDPFKNGGRPESHGGTQQAGATATQALPADVARQLESVTKVTLTAQQYGNLASMRHASGAIHDLGDRMVVTNSRINKAIAAALPAMPGEEQMSASERSTFDALARSANEREFGVSVAEWIAERYPAAISALESVAGTPALRDLSGSLPEMRSQLADAQKILQAASAPAASTGSLRDPSSNKKSD